MWYSFFGPIESPYPLEFPYQATSPTLRKSITYTEEEVWLEVDRIVQESQGTSYTLGQSLWYNLILCSNMDYFYDPEMNFLIREYNMCKQFNVPPARSIDEAEYLKMVTFSAIDEEVNACTKHQQEKNKNGK